MNKLYCEFAFLQFECCGMDGPSKLFGSLPLSCCKEEHLTTDFLTKNRRCSEAYAFKDDCRMNIPFIEKMFLVAAALAIIFGIAEVRFCYQHVHILSNFIYFFCLFQLFGVLFSCVLYAHLDAIYV